MAQTFEADKENLKFKPNNLENLADNEVYKLFNLTNDEIDL